MIVSCRERVGFATLTTPAPCGLDRSRYRTTGLDDDLPGGTMRDGAGPNCADHLAICE